MDCKPQTINYHIMKQNIHYYLLVMAIAMLWPMLGLADNAPVNNSGTGGSNGDPDGVPVDGGLLLLIVTGAGYGLKKLKEWKGNMAKE